MYRLMMHQNLMGDLLLLVGTRSCDRLARAAPSPRLISLTQFRPRRSLYVAFELARELSPSLISISLPPTIPSLILTSIIPLRSGGDGQHSLNNRVARAFASSRDP